MIYKQDPPFCIDLEVTEGCNLRCDFCGIQAIRESTGDYRFMTVYKAEAIAKSIAKAGWTSRIEMSGHGEPSMNQHLEEIIGVFRKHLPKNQILVTSNGGGFLGKVERVEKLFKAGLNILALDNYQHVKIVPKLIEQLGFDIPIYDYPKDGLEWSPHKRHPKGTKFIAIIEDISVAKEGVHKNINNRAGQAAPPNLSAMGKRCVKPFRDLVIRWDGNVNSCCNDYRGIIKIGNAAETDIAELWNNNVFNSLRKFMYHGQRNFKPCAGCDFVGFRPGLLPDKLGKAELDKPDLNDLDVIKCASLGGSYTPVVLREWEK